VCAEDKEEKMEEVKTYDDLIGGVFTSVENKEDEELVFTREDGAVFKFWHMQECCESVLIEDIDGPLDVLVGSPIVMAEEVMHEQDTNPAGMPSKEYQDSFTWTFYKFATAKGSVTVRWYGESNGYYSEQVDFCRF